MARIEADERDLEKLMRERKAIAGELKALGYGYITLDMEGFRSGSMDEALPREITGKIKHQP